MNSETKQKTMTCPKCNGRGHIADFAGIAGGICFRCEGRGVVPYRAPRAYKAPVLSDDDLLDVGDVLGGRPFDRADKERCKAHREHIGVTRMGYEKLRAMYQRKIKITRGELRRLMATK